MSITKNQHGQLELELRGLTIVCDIRPGGILVSDLALMCKEAIDAMTSQEVEEFLEGALTTPAAYMGGRLSREIDVIF